MTARATPALCVHCRRKPVDPAWRPFCSAPSKTLDLARWADGGYAVPGEPLMEPDAEGDDEGETRKGRR